VAHAALSCGGASVHDDKPDGTAGSGGDAGSTGGADPYPTAAAYCDGLAETQCRLLVRCCQDAARPLDEIECQRSVREGCADYLSAGGYDSRKGAECIAAYGTWDDCRSGLQELAVCDAVVPPLEVGSPCIDVYQCAGAATCSSGVCAEATYSEEGDECTADRKCPPGSGCARAAASATPTCQRYLAAGMPCGAFGRPCETGFCDSDTSTCDEQSVVGYCPR